MQHCVPHHKPSVTAAGEVVVVVDLQVVAVEVAVDQQVVAAEVVVAVPQGEEEEVVEEALHQQLDPLDRFKEEVITPVTA